MSYIIKNIKQNISKNRNYSIAAVGRVGTGKSYSSLKLATALQPSFTVDNIVFDIPTLLEKVHNEEVKAGEVLIFDEAGISASNRESYMNKFNKAMSFLLQTWRHRQIILIITVPDIAFIDAGVRKLFDAVMECKEVIKSKNVVRVNWKFMQSNVQSGKMYYHNPKTVNMETIGIEIGKPNIKLVNAYEKKKKEFTTVLYQQLQVKIEEKAEVESKKDIRRCPQCESLDTVFSMRRQEMRCRQCGHIWKKEKRVTKALTLAQKS